MPQYVYRFQYIQKLDENRKRKRDLKFIRVYRENIMENDYWISSYDINQLENIYIDNDDEKSEVIVYFKKVYQQLFDDDPKYRYYFKKCKELIPDELQQFKDALRIVICNKTDDKQCIHLS